MTWSIENSQGNESRHVVWDLVPYMRGKALDLGCGPYKALPHFIGVDSCKDTDLFGIQMKPDLRADVTKLEMFASGSFDCCYSSHTLEHIEFKDVPDTLKEWMRVLRRGGHLCLYLPDEDEYPKCTKEAKEEWRKWCEKNEPSQFGNSAAAVEAFAKERRASGFSKTGDVYAGTPFGNPDHKWDVNYDKVVGAMESVPWSWDLVEFEKRDKGDEYSLWFVFKRL